MLTNGISFENFRIKKKNSKVKKKLLSILKNKNKIDTKEFFTSVLSDVISQECSSRNFGTSWNSCNRMPQTSQHLNFLFLNLIQNDQIDFAHVYQHQTHSFQS